MIQGVEVSVRPEVILTSPGKSRTVLVGAAKLHFPRTFALDAESAGFVSAILQRWTDQHLLDSGVTNGALCPVIDIGSRTFYPGVKATAARMKEVEANCQNIAAIWDSI